MLCYSTREVAAQANVESTLAILKNVDAIRCQHSAMRKLVAGAGFEPATFRL